MENANGKRKGNNLMKTLDAFIGGQILRNNGARRLGRPRTGVLPKKLPEEWTEELTEDLWEDLIEVTNSGRLQRWKTATGKQKWKTACACPFTIPFSQETLDFKSSFSQGILSPCTPFSQWGKGKACILGRTHNQHPQAKPGLILALHLPRPPRCQR